jgi:hypothetical protein
MQTTDHGPSLSPLCMSLWHILFFIMFAHTPALPASALDHWPGVFLSGVFIHLYLCEQQSCLTRVKIQHLHFETLHRMSVFLLIYHHCAFFTSSAKIHGSTSTLPAAESSFHRSILAHSCSGWPSPSQNNPLHPCSMTFIFPPASTPA